MRKLFGTDGVRGVANQYPITADVAVRLGQAVAHYFLNTQKRSYTNQRPRILIGKDTRLSCYMIECGLAAGIASMGADVQLVGPLPTPGISFITEGMRADAGIVISASHNSFEDNGIKIFGPDGFKLPDEAELAIEELFFTVDQLDKVHGKNIGRVRRIDDAAGRYIVFVKNTFPRDLSLDGLRIVLDCANGAGYKVAPAVLRELGAEVFTLGVDPDGTNINAECGSLFPGGAARRVHETRADIGITLDGDADRVVLIDERGEVLNGDTIIGLVATYLKRNNMLRKPAIVATVMSNIGLEMALRKEGIELVRAKVGDRYVVGAMRDHDINFGGEQSGHLIFLDHALTGDGLIAALQVLAIMQRSKKRLSDLAKEIKLYPQTLVNIKVKSKPPLEELEEFQKEVKAAEKKLKDRGRILVRYSGTEPKARVMVEGPNEEQIHTIAEHLADVLQREINS